MGNHGFNSDSEYANKTIEYLKNCSQELGRIANSLKNGGPIYREVYEPIDEAISGIDSLITSLEQRNKEVTSLEAIEEAKNPRRKGGFWSKLLKSFFLV